MEVFEKYKCPDTVFFLHSSRYVSNEQSYLKPTGLYDDLILLSSLFHVFYYIFTAFISFSLCFPIFHLFLLFFDVLSQTFIKHSIKACVCVYMCVCVCICVCVCVCVYIYIYKTYLKKTSEF